MSTVDIIIPVYNTCFNNLYKCLESLKAQTFTDWRAILIDDGSNAETANQLDEYMESDSRFQVFHYRNAGPGEARNRGIEKIESPYVTFLDSDDEFMPLFLEIGIRKIYELDADMYVCGSQTVRNGTIKQVYAAEQGIHIIEHNEILNLLEKAVSTYNTSQTLFTQNTLVARLVLKIYKKELLVGERINSKVRISEDSLFSFRIIRKCKKIIIDSYIGYRINLTDTSLSRGKKPEVAINDLLVLASEFNKEKENLFQIKLDDAYRARLLSIFAFIHTDLSKLSINNTKRKYIYKELLLDERFTELKKTSLRKYIESNKRQVTLHKKVLAIILRQQLEVKVFYLLLDGLLIRILKKDRSG